MNKSPEVEELGTGRGNHEEWGEVMEGLSPYITFRPEKEM